MNKQQKPIKNCVGANCTTTYYAGPSMCIVNCSSCGETNCSNDNQYYNWTYNNNNQLLTNGNYITNDNEILSITNLANSSSRNHQIQPLI